MRKKQDLFQEESNKMIEKGRNLISEKTNLSSKFVSANSMYYIGPLIETIGSMILAAFKHGIQNTDDEKTIRLCLEGMQSTILLCCHFNLENERKNFVEALYTLSALEDYPNNFRKKHFAVIKTALNLTTKISNNLQEAWYPILNILSK